MSIQLVIKGNIEESTEATSNLGMLLFDAEENTHNETIGQVDEKHINKVIKWFCACQNNEKAPFPPGTLLFYSYN